MGNVCKGRGYSKKNTHIYDQLILDVGARNIKLSLKIFSK